MAKKILVVDDERAIAWLIQVNLERQGYLVVVAFDGKEALKKVASERPDVTVLDVMMPCMDGFEVLRTLKTDPKTRQIPVIMLTARRHDADLFQAWQSGADCCLTKPFNPAELIALIKRLLDDDGPGPGAMGGWATVG